MGMEGTEKYQEEHDNNVEEEKDDGVGEEEEEADEEEEEDEDELASTSYVLRFEGEMDPLAFTEDDPFGVQPYQQLERLEHEYEALAAKKRKASADHGTTSKKSRKDDITGSSFDEVLDTMAFGKRRKSRKTKKRGRRKGSKNKVSPEVTRKLGDATLHYAHGRYEEAIRVLKEAILLSPNMPDPYHTLGLVYNAIGDKKRAMNFYMLAAHLTPKDASLWKLLVAWSIEQGNHGQAKYCLSKAITADPEDIGLRIHRASLYVELGDYFKAAESYEQIFRLCPNNVEALKTATKCYQKCGQHERGFSILEDYLKSNQEGADLSVVHLLASMLMEGNAHVKALHYIEYAEQVCCTGKELPLNLRVKAGICHAHLGDIEKAEAIFSANLPEEKVNEFPNLTAEVADSLMTLQRYGSALKYYMMLVDKCEDNNGTLFLKVARCYQFLNERVQAIDCLYKAVLSLDHSIDARLILASLLLEEDKDDDAISVLSPPPDTEMRIGESSGKSQAWWLDGKIKLKLSQIYRSKGLHEAFVDAIFPLVRESLFLETMRQKVRVKKRLTRSVLFERAKVLDDQQIDNVFHGFRPVASTSELLKAARARKLLKKKETLREERRAEALAAGIELKSDDSDEDSPPKQELKEPPLPNLLRDEEHHRLIIDLCKALATLQRHWEAVEIINLSLKLANNTLSTAWKEELRSLGAQISYNIADPANGWDCARYIVNQNPYSFAAWNCFYKIISRADNKFSKHKKFLHSIRVKHSECVPPIMIFGNQLTGISQHQSAAREYLEAYKLMPDSPLINLCVGTALINVALGLRLHNKNQCVVQGLAFLYNNLQHEDSRQETLYNIARAYHHVGMVTLAAKYYEEVLGIHQKDYPIPKLPNEGPDVKNTPKPGGYCDLRREAAYNLHLIYKRSGALDLARQVLKDHCSF